VENRVNWELPWDKWGDGLWKGIKWKPPKWQFTVDLHGQACGKCCPKKNPCSCKDYYDVGIQGHGTYAGGFDYYFLVPTPIGIPIPFKVEVRLRADGKIDVRHEWGGCDNVDRWAGCASFTVGFDAYLCISLRIVEACCGLEGRWGCEKCIGRAKSCSGSVQFCCKFVVDYFFGKRTYKECFWGYP
jgi:hypothetical protein